MRFVWAVVALVLAALLIGAGIAQRTVFLGPDQQQAQLSVDEPLLYTMIDGDVLRSQPGEQTLKVEGQGDVLVAQARSADLTAWLTDARYNRVSLTDSGEIVSDVVEPEIVVEEEGDSSAATEESTDGAEASTDGAEAGAGRNPAGSDLWLDEFNAEGSLTDRMQVPEGVAVLVASDGQSNAPSKVVVSWPLENSTPWAGPLMVAGGILMAIGVVLYILAIRHVRRGRGPRRKGPPPEPPTEPIDLAIDSPRRFKPLANRPGRGSLLAVPALGLAVVVLAGCTSDAWPQKTSPATPSPTPTVLAPENQQAPVMTEHQAARVLKKLAKTVAEADANVDATLAATRLSGPALRERETDYAVRAAVAEYQAPSAIPSDKIRVLVPQAFDGWPRTTLVLAENGADETVPPVIMTMTQEDPWSDYRVNYLAEMQASAKLPDLPPAWLGAKLTPPDTPFLIMEPGQLAEAFAGVVDEGEESASYTMFDTGSVEFAETINASRQAIVQALADSGASETSSMAFDLIPSDDAPVGLAGIDSGAVVAVSLKDVQTITPSQEGVDIRLQGNEPAKALTGVESSAKGFVTTYGMQLFFSVPARGSSAQIQLLAVSQELLSVEVIP